MNTWGLRGTLAAVGISAVVAGVGGAAIYAATGEGPRAIGMQGPPGGISHDHAAGSPRDANVEASALHGEFVVPDGKGGFTTVLSQTGHVTAISPNSVTARSDDGYSQTYVIAALGSAASNMHPVVVNDAVTIRATRNGTIASLTTIQPAHAEGDAEAPPSVAGKN
jgi:hypothetical protein